MEYDEIYSKTEDYFGADPDPLLKEQFHRLARAAPILDVGAGQGRNALYLARSGLAVDAVDPSRAAMEALKRIAAAESLPLRTCSCGFERFVTERGAYGAVLLFGVVQVLPWESIRLLIEKVTAWVRPGGLVFVTAFTREDPAFARHTQEWRSIGKNAFKDLHGNIRTYLEGGELLELFKGFQAIHHWEGFGPRHRHGDGPEERHARAEALFLKPETGQREPGP